MEEYYLPLDKGGLDFIGVFSPTSLQAKKTVKSLVREMDFFSCESFPMQKVESKRLILL